MEPIDIVYTWVDGSRADWIARRRDVQAQGAPRLARDAVTPNRSLDRQELRYSLRSVAAHASWVRHIYIVTPGQRPAWLAPSTRITVVDQDSLFPDRRDTPTFNSHAIESHLDRIPGLQERFLYLNDDMFFVRPVGAADYFDESGRARIAFALKRRLQRRGSDRYAEAPTGEPQAGDNGYISGWRNNSRLLDAVFDSGPHYLPSHQAQAMTRTIMARTRELFAAEFTRVSARRFRSLDDIAPIGLAAHVGLHYGLAVGSDAVLGTVVSYSDRVLRNALALWLVASDHHTLCLNDDTSSPPGSLRSRIVSIQIQRAMAKRFPVAATWEGADSSASRRNDAAF